MKTLFLAAYLLFTVARAAVADEVGVASVEVDAVAMRYRVRLNLPTDTGYCFSDLTVAADGLAPWGVRVRIADAADAPIASGSGDRDYSSSDMYSGSSLTQSDCVRVPASPVVVTDWYKIADLVRGFQQCSHVPPEKWAKLKIEVTVRVSGTTDSTASAQSAWIILTPAMRNTLVADL